MSEIFFSCLLLLEIIFVSWPLENVLHRPVLSMQSSEFILVRKTYWILHNKTYVWTAGGPEFRYVAELQQLWNTRTYLFLMASDNHFCSAHFCLLLLFCRTPDLFLSSDKIIWHQILCQSNLMRLLEAFLCLCIWSDWSSCCHLASLLVKMDTDSHSPWVFLPWYWPDFPCHHNAFWRLYCYLNADISCMSCSPPQYLGEQSTVFLKKKRMSSTSSFQQIFKIHF